MDNNNEVRYLYSVYPKKPIKNLNEALPLIRVSKSLYLTKDEVRKCLLCASVYRRFANEGIQEKVTNYELDRLHNEKYISKEDWYKIESKALKDLSINGVPAAVEEPPVEEEKKPEKITVTVVNNPIPETLDVEVKVVEEQPEVEESTVEETVVEDTTDEVEETVAEDVVEDSEEVAEDTTDKDEVIEEAEIELDGTDEDEEVVPEEKVVESSVTVNYNVGKKKKHH